MPLSNNLWKQAKVIENPLAKEIVTTTIKEQETEEPLVNNQYMAEAEMALQPYREQLMADAKIAAEALKDRAYAEGKAQGYDDGYAEGKAVGDQMAHQISMEATQNFATAQAEIGSYVIAKQNELVTLAVEMASAIVKTKIELEPETLATVITPMLQKLAEPDQLLTVTANPACREILQAKLESKKAEINNFRYLILDDMQLAATDLKVETSDSLIVFNLENELQELLQQLQQ